MTTKRAKFASNHRKKLYHRRFPAKIVVWELALRIYQSCPSSQFTAAMAGEMCGLTPVAMGQKLMSMASASMVYQAQRHTTPGTQTWWAFTDAFRAFMQEHGEEFGCV